MAVVYKEIESEDEITQCIDLQRDIFGLSETDLISPLLLKLIARNNPPIGISIGVFINTIEKSELIGYLIGFATFIDKSVYTVQMGIKPEFQNKVYGYKLSLKSRDVAIEKGLNCMYCIFDPLDSNLGRLYVTSLGFKGVKYQMEAYKLSNSNQNQIPIDKFLAKWDFFSEQTLQKLKGTKEFTLDEVLKQYPVAKSNNMPDSPIILIEIPYDFKALASEDFQNALNWRQSTRAIFSEYMNSRNYLVRDCFSNKTPSGRKTYYLLEKGIA